MENEEKIVNLGDKVVGEVELPKFDAEKYIGTKVNIASVKEMTGVYGYFIRVETDPVETYKGADGEPKDIRGSMNFGLVELEDGKIGWGKDAKLGMFLKHMKVNHYRDLVGKQVILQVERKGDKTYLIF